jgi:Flp pilus assembly protein TadB
LPIGTLDSWRSIEQSGAVPDPPTNEWEHAYEQSVRRQDERAKSAPGYAFATFSINLQGLIVASSIAAIAVGLVGRMLGVGGTSVFVITFGAAFVVGGVIWWRRSKRDSNR